MMPTAEEIRAQGYEPVEVTLPGEQPNYLHGKQAEWHYDALAAVKELINRFTHAETQLALIADRWSRLTHEEKLAINDVSEGLADALVRIEP